MLVLYRYRNRKFVLYSLSVPLSSSEKSYTHWDHKNRTPFLVVLAVRSINVGTFSFFPLLWLPCSIRLDTPCQLTVSLSLLCLSMSGLVILQYSSLSFNALIQCSHSQYNFTPSFSITFPGSQFTAYHFVSSGSNRFSIAYFTASTFRVLSCRLTYSDPASFLHPDRC